MFTKCVHRIAGLAVVLSAAHTLPASASSVVGPTLTVDVTVGANNPARRVDLTAPDPFAIVRRTPYDVQGQVVLTQPIFNTSWAAGADIYFGVILPGQTAVYTWTPNGNGTVALNNGYTPLARAYPVLSASTFTTSSVNSGNLISYTFSGAEKKGLYLVFLFMMPTGTVPTDIDLSSATMQPFVVK